jgi:hypothetical protein
MLLRPQRPQPPIKAELERHTDQTSGRQRQKMIPSDPPDCPRTARGCVGVIMVVLGSRRYLRIGCRDTVLMWRERDSLSDRLIGRI